MCLTHTPGAFEKLHATSCAEEPDLDILDRIAREFLLEKVKLRLHQLGRCGIPLASFLQAALDALLENILPLEGRSQTVCCETHS